MSPQGRHVAVQLSETIGVDIDDTMEKTGKVIM
jgi:hypothetical protein